MNKKTKTKKPKIVEKQNGKTIIKKKKKNKKQIKAQSENII